MTILQNLLNIGWLNIVYIIKCFFFRSDAFSVSALLRPDLPRRPQHPHHTAGGLQEALAVTRSLIYPSLPFADILLRDKPGSEYSQV